MLSNIPPMSMCALLLLARARLLLPACLPSPAAATAAGASLLFVHADAVLLRSSQPPRVSGKTSCGRGSHRASTAPWDQYVRPNAAAELGWALAIASARVMVAAAPTPGSWPPVCWPAGWADNGYKTPFSMPQPQTLLARKSEPAT
jgi:hypothetical protein